MVASAETTGPTPEAKPLLSVADVSMTFDRMQVLRNINLDVRKGETVAVIGESGCGKTVMLKLLVGLLGPTKGTVTFDGRQMVKLRGAELVKQRLRFGMVFQQAALFDSLNVFENVAFGLRCHGRRSEEQIIKEVRDRLMEVGLSTDIVAKMPVDLSGGMRKRVGLARAVALGPEVMLYDEPTTGLDPIMSDVIAELILRQRKARPVTSVVVTHDMRLAEKVSDRVVMFYPLARLKPGEPQILFDGSPEELQKCRDPRVQQFVRGEAGDRVAEISSN